MLRQWPNFKELFYTKKISWEVGAKTIHLKSFVYTEVFHSLLYFVERCFIVRFIINYGFPAGLIRWMKRLFKKQYHFLIWDNNWTHILSQMAQTLGRHNIIVYFFTYKILFHLILWSHSSVRSWFQIGNIQQQSQAMLQAWGSGWKLHGGKGSGDGHPPGALPAGHITPYLITATESAHQCPSLPPAAQAAVPIHSLMSSVKGWKCLQALLRALKASL